MIEFDFTSADEAYFCTVCGEKVHTLAEQAMGDPIRPCRCHIAAKRAKAGLPERPKWRGEPYELVTGGSR